jgi:uncharacterized protein (TIGR02145 family)
MENLSFRKVILVIIVFALFPVTLSDCTKSDPAIKPVLSTSPVINIAATNATAGGFITSDGGAEVNSYGVCWGTTTDPSTSDSKTSDGTGIGQFVSSLTSLTAGTTYHVRAYATNSAGTSYGADVSFTTLGQVPECITLPATNISTTGAILNGAINSNSVSTTVTFEYGTTTSYGQTTTAVQSPLTGNSITNVSKDISGLTPGRTYHYRVKSVNSIGTVNGGDMIFVTLTSITDIDGNSYSIVTIGNQVWMKENLKVTKYNDGSAIPNVTDKNAWLGLTTGAYCWYNNDAGSNKNTYGGLYNWYAVSDNRNICPTGWHAPTDAEWKILEMSLGMTQAQADREGYGRGTTEGGKLKETIITHWLSPNTGATNESGFTALPSGTRNLSGSFEKIGEQTYLWSSTVRGSDNAWGRSLSYDSTRVYRGDFYFKKIDGFSVRCLKD